MYLKHYAEVDDISEAIQYYINNFSGMIIKGYSPGTDHAYLVLFKQIKLMLYTGISTHKSLPNNHIVIRFEKNEVEDFYNAIHTIKEEECNKIIHDIFHARWGTTFFEFMDPFGHIWDFEIDSDVVKQVEED